MVVSPWLLLQYAECFAGGFLVSFCLCYPRSPKNREELEKEEGFVFNSDEKSVIIDEFPTTTTEVPETKKISLEGNPSVSEKEEDDEKAKCIESENLSCVCQPTMKEEKSKAKEQLID